jgi:hypothetical protein
VRPSRSIWFLQFRALRLSGTVGLDLAETGVVGTWLVTGFWTPQARGIAYESGERLASANDPSKSGWVGGQLNALAPVSGSRGSLVEPVGHADGIGR